MWHLERHVCQTESVLAPLKLYQKNLLTHVKEYSVKCIEIVLSSPVVFGSCGNVFSSPAVFSSPMDNISGLANVMSDVSCKLLYLFFTVYEDKLPIYRDCEIPELMGDHYSQNIQLLVCWKLHNVPKYIILSKTEIWNFCITVL